MTQGHELCSSLGGHDARQARSLKDVPLGKTALPHLLHRLRRYADPPGGHRLPLGNRLVSHVHHANSPGRREVSQLGRAACHGSSRKRNLSSGYTPTVWPAARRTVSSGTMRSELALAKATISPEPRVAMGYATKPPASGSIHPGRNARRGPRLDSASLSVAERTGRWGCRQPSILARAGRTKSSKVTMVETGFPGRPNTRPPWLERPTIRGFPGFSATASKRVLTPSSARTFSTRSRRPTDTPPERSSASASRPSPMSSLSDSSVSNATPR